MKENKDINNNINMTKFKDEIFQEIPPKKYVSNENINRDNINNINNINENNMREVFAENPSPINTSSSKLPISNRIFSKNLGLILPKLYIFSHCQKMKFCLLYFVVVVGIFAFFLINYLSTKNAFEENKFILLPPDKLCQKTLKVFSDCLKNKSISDRCFYENKAVEQCYDESNSLNRLCFIYLSELELCLRTNGKTFVDKCEINFREVVDCGSTYKYLQLDSDYLKKIIMDE